MHLHIFSVFMLAVFWRGTRQRIKLLKESGREEKRITTESSNSFIRMYWESSLLSLAIQSMQEEIRQKNDIQIK